MGVILAWAVDTARIHIQQRPFRAVWDNIIGDQRSIAIVIGGMKQESFHPEHTPSNSVSKVPQNVHLLGVQDAIASSLLQQRLVSVYGMGALISEPIDFNDIRSTFISVGGWSVNARTYDVLVQNKLDAKFQMFYPEHYAVDGFDGKRYNAELDADKNVVKDYGFIIVGQSPYDQEKMVCVAFGIWPQGTSASLHALIDPDVKSQLGREFIAKLRTHQGVLAVVETRVSGLQPGRPVLIKVRDLIKVSDIESK